MKVYKASGKAIMKGVFTSLDRIILLGDGSAVLYQGEHLVQSDVVYREKDSHLEETNEQIPKILYATPAEIRHILNHGIKLPMTVVPGRNGLERS